MTTQQRSAVVMLGKPVAEQIENKLKAEVPGFIERHKIVPSLAIVQVGKNPASVRYIQKKIEACARLSMKAELFLFDDTISADDLKAEVEKLSRNAAFHGILVQLPLPSAIEEHDSERVNKFDIFDAIAPEKDVDGVGLYSIAELYRAQQDRLRFLAGTALAVRRMIAFYNIETTGKRAVVVGRNDITAKPVLHMLGGRMCNAAAIWCHRYVPVDEQRELIRSADILVTSVGSPNYHITADIVKPGAVIIDIATRFTPEGKLTGDIDYEPVRAIASHITPVPRGVGPVTVAALTENLFRAAQYAVGVGELGYTF